MSDDAGGITPEDAERRQAASDYWREALQIDSHGQGMTTPIILTASKAMHTTLVPRYDHKAITSAKRRLTDMIGLPSLAAFVSSHGGWLMSNLAKILPAELARLESAGAPAKQTIRLGATPPSKPTTPPKPPVHQFIPAPKPSAPPAKQGTKSGALSIGEAEALAGQVFKDYAPASSVTEAGRWKSLEGVFAAHGHSAPWHDTKNVAIPWPKLVGHAARTRKIAQVFETGLTRSEFGKMSAFDQSNFCKSGGQLRD